MSKNTDVQPKLAHKLGDVVDQANSEICVTLLRYNVDQAENSYARFQMCAMKEQERGFNKLIMWNMNLKNLSIHLM